ncbi:MAG: ribonucleotide reductase N-terminal alpha domain-containing protein, partial [Hyphomicrobiaceae bacterium]
MSPPKTPARPAGWPQDWPRISSEIWDAKYRLKSADGAPAEASIAETWKRVAEEAAAAEKSADRAHWTNEFTSITAGFAFLPAGRILAGIGSGRNVTLFNCFVMGEIADDLSDIFENVQEAALTMQSGGGIGHDFSTLRPK